MQQGLRNGTVSVCPSVSLSHSPAAAAVCCCGPGRQEISIDRDGRRALQQHGAAARRSLANASSVTFTAEFTRLNARTCSSRVASSDSG